MNAERLLAHYERIADAPDAIARLRQLVLELAIRGKIVPQNSIDESAFDLIKRIIRNTSFSTKLKKPGDRSYNDSEIGVGHFGIPINWTWTTLGTVSDIVMGQSPPGDTYNNFGEGVPLINGPVEFTSGPFGRTLVNQYTTAPTNFCDEGDLLICVRGSTTGRTNIAGFRACIGRGVAAIKPRFESAFIRLFVWKMRTDIIEMGRGIAFPSVSRKQLEDLPIALPPLAEQQRIVAKVDELMALCDQLEAARAEREATRDRLAAASLARLNTPDPVTFQADARFALNILPALTTRPDQIKQLRQTILNLAVRGKLVPQDPDDEPTSTLLKLIAIEKSKLAKEGKIKQPNLPPIIEAKPKPFDIPGGWEWSQPDEFSLKITDGEHFRPQTVDHGIYFLSAKDIREEGVSLAEPLYISKETASKARSRCDPEFGDLLIVSRGATCGRICKVNIKETFCLLGSVILIKPSSYIDNGYLEYALKSEMIFTALVSASGATAQGAIYLRDLKKISLPLPPLAEQHRIVAKVNALMVICEQLEANLHHAATTQHRLLNAILAEALAPSKKRELEAAE